MSSVTTAVIAIGATPAVLLGALGRRAVTKHLHPERHQERKDATRNRKAGKAMTPAQREMGRQES